MEEITEYSQGYAGECFLVLPMDPVIEEIYPIKRRIEYLKKMGGHVFKRKVIVLEDWEEI